MASAWSEHGSDTDPEMPELIPALAVSAQRRVRRDAQARAAWTDLRSAGEEQELLGTVRRWMAEKAVEVSLDLEGGCGAGLPADSLHEFTMRVRFQAHVWSTPLHHAPAMVQVIVEDALSGLRWGDEPALQQPAGVARRLEPGLTRWAPLLEPLWASIGDPLAGTRTVVLAVQAGVAVAAPEEPEATRACAEVGCCSALRQINMMQDEELLTCLQQLPSRGKVMDKFKEFLKEALADDSDDEED